VRNGGIRQYLIDEEDARRGCFVELAKRLHETKACVVELVGDSETFGMPDRHTLGCPQAPRPPAAARPMEIALAPSSECLRSPLHQLSIVAAAKARGA
jgi:hypothetical protein